MYPVWIVVFFGALLAAHVAVDVPRRETLSVELAADVSATNFLAYRRAVQRYVAANPGATGTVSDSNLTSFWLPGYMRDASWTNTVSGGALYVYSAAATAPGMLEALHQKEPENALIGTKNAATGRLQSYNGFDTGIVLPGGIPNNAIVMMGR